ncbi:uncharacterized protein BDZ99DRAFT_451574 [Mytilinidion resinicola]|uniref:DUF6594 domain-containing protein n=1 Tax=Mytilinidion resinicola TaxID=574789 RepID=A0A6A6Y7K7_9PEZI|nr:uncharacterized protein BDZ99DRAFT_451574 [Mytilinidion resinicola]KAF2804513.1 hypothetical protein BDZ99DRAFT_451574 [Mytilinidion resinicola]
MQIEDHPAGYPRFSALVASHDSFHLCRRFSNLRSRLLLLKQDRISSLEKQLQKVDHEETVPLRLGSTRADDNSERKFILSQIDDALADYDGLIVRNHQIFSFEAARPRAVASLQNWINGTGCIARHEATYLNYSNELLCVASMDDTVMMWLETLVECTFTRARQYFGKNRHLNISRDPNVHITSKPSVTRIARVLMTPFIATLLLAPVIVCNCLTSLIARLSTIVIAATMFIAILSGSTKAKTVELVVAGATYTTVLIVFISSTSMPKN